MNSSKNNLNTLLLQYKVYSFLFIYRVFI